MIRDYNLDPPNNPDQGEPCAECGQELGEEYWEARIPGGSISRIHVCSPECETQYLIGYADWVMDG